MNGIPVVGRETQPLGGRGVIVHIRIRRSEFSSLSETRRQHDLGLDHVGHTVDAADVRRLITQVSGPAKTATGTWIYNTATQEGELDFWLTLSDEEFIDAVKAKGPVQHPNQGAPADDVCKAIPIVTADLSLVSLIEAHAALKTQVESLARQLRILQIQLQSSNLTGISAAYVVSNAFPEGAVDSDKVLGDIPTCSNSVPRPDKFKQLSPDTPEFPKIQASLFALTAGILPESLQAHDTHQNGYPSEPVQLPDVTVTESEGRSTRWCDHEVTGEFKNELDGKKTTKGLCQLVTRLQAIFNNQPRRRKTFGFLADTRHVIICRAEKTDDNVIFWRTKPMTMLDAAGGWAEGGKALINLFRSGSDKLGRPPPLFQKCTIQILREGVGSQSHIISAGNNNDGEDFVVKLFSNERLGNYQREIEALRKLQLAGGVWQTNSPAEWLGGWAAELHRQIQSANSLGVVHGDISPSNIRTARNHATEIAPERLTTTLPYCSARGHPLRLHLRTTSLFYSLVAIAFGRVPWRASTWDDMETLKDAHSNLDHTWTLYCADKREDICDVLNLYRR
ncbi:hypothetical protein PROFUN_06654 [Planoprotostelium fungivorum]|uniref:Uncharacterized protein n=1 Tax=Planoprotostelium fungivorum TaxID=1890364 RepID=A0A2P6MSW8_9EUKA|nr:hypothetical protein PROFUN_06654 [Planoprotostelium fungivorum]